MNANEWWFDYGGTYKRTWKSRKSGKQKAESEKQNFVASCDQNQNVKAEKTIKTKMKLERSLSFSGFSTKLFYARRLTRPCYCSSVPLSGLLPCATYLARFVAVDAYKLASTATNRRHPIPLGLGGPATI